MRFKAFIIFFWFTVMLPGCVTTKSMHDKATDPVLSHEIGKRLRSQEDIDYWKKVKENNEKAIIILDNP